MFSKQKKEQNKHKIVECLEKVNTTIQNIKQKTTRALTLVLCFQKDAVLEPQNRKFRRCAAEFTSQGAVPFRWLEHFHSGALSVGRLTAMVGEIIGCEDSYKVRKKALNGLVL